MQLSKGETENGQMNFVLLVAGLFLPLSALSKLPHMPLAPNANEAIDKLANLAIKTCHKLPAKVIRFAYLSFD